MPGWGEGDTLMGKSLAETAGGDWRRNIRQIVLGFGSAFGMLSIRATEHRAGWLRVWGSGFENGSEIL